GGCGRSARAEGRAGRRLDRAQPGLSGGFRHSPLHASRLYAGSHPKGGAIAMICQSCGVEAPTRKVFFVQHIGAIVMFFHKRVGGLFCRNCVNKYFTEYFFITLGAGWGGVISVFATPVVLLIDIVNYFRAWTLEPVPAGAGAPVLT